MARLKSNPIRAGFRRISLPVFAALTALLVTAAARLPAQDLANLRGDFMAEARILEAEIDDYFSTRESEQEALAELARKSRQLDDALGDAHGSVADLVGLESQVAAAREQAFGLSEESAGTRRRLYEGMKRLSAMARQLEGLGIGPAGDGGVGGSWHVEASPDEIYGVMELAQNGALIAGTYRLSNGAHGSLVGTYAGRRLEIQLIDSRHGVVGSIRGDLDPDSGEIYGIWQARELADRRPTAGHWTARRLSLQDVEASEDLEQLEQLPAAQSR